MTVQELIKDLEKLEDKDLELYMNYPWSSCTH